MKIFSVLFAASLWGTLANAQTPGRQVAVADLAWLEGSWTGDGIGGAPATEVYSEPAGGQIVGHFRQLGVDGSIMFYELITILPVDGKLTYRVKHFDADLNGWEGPDETIDFRLLGACDDEWIFDGLTIRRLGADRMTITVRVSDEAGKLDHLIFDYRRTRSTLD